MKNNFLTKTEVVLLSLVFCSLMLKHSLSSIFMGVFVCYSVFISIKKKRGFNIDKNFYAPLLLYVFFIMSIVWSHDVELTLKGLSRTLILAVLPLSLSFNVIIKRAQVNKVFTIFSLVNCSFGLLFLIDSFISFQKHHDSSTFFYHDFVSLLDLNAIYVSSFFYVSIVFLLFKHKKLWIDYVCLFVLFIFILFLSSKIMVIISILTLLVFLFLYKRKQSFLFLGLMMIAVVFYFGFSKLETRFSSEFETNLSEVIYKERFTKVYPWTGASIRLLQLRILKEQLSENDIFLGGFGLFASRESLRENHERLNTYYGFHEYNYHNTYAQMLSELGLVGLILLILNLIYLIKMSFAKNQIWLIFVSVMFSIWFFTESVLWVQRGLFIFILIYCVLVKFEKESNFSN